MAWIGTCNDRDDRGGDRGQRRWLCNRDGDCATKAEVAVSQNGASGNGAFKREEQ
ncbi:Outer membrane protein assembly factor BamA [Sesbania bispinosa]|nr:Outer membrane protein assembly factor BamA [Sesbania bispinosa]